MSYAIFRVEPINKLKDLGQIGAHNIRTKEAYKSNPDIDKRKSINNINLVPITHKDYYTSYMSLVKDYKKQHEEKQKTERENRKKTFNQMLDDSNSVVADELLFTSDKEFFENMNKYFQGASSTLTVNNYTGPVEDLFSLYQGNIPENAYPKVIPWLEKALAFPQMSVLLRTRVLCLLGDCWKETGDRTKAKQCYNQAFMESMQMEQEMTKAMIQMRIKQKLAALDLIK